MEIINFDTESGLFGMLVIKFDDWDEVDEILGAEERLKNENNSLYLFCEVDATDLHTIQKLEKAGYHFSEFRITSTLNTDDAEIFTRHIYPYEARLIGDEHDLEITIEILKSNVQDDRFSNDPLLNLNNTFERNKANLIKSFDSPKNEFLLGVFNAQSGNLHAFRSGAYTAPGQAHFYQYGVNITDEKETMKGILESLTISFLKSNGIRLIHAVSTGFNISEINHLIKDHSFTITSSHLLLRKIIPCHNLSPKS